MVASELRVQVLQATVESVQTPSQLADDLGAWNSHVSRALGELSERELVALLVSDDQRVGRLYGATDAGRAIWQAIESEELGT